MTFMTLDAVITIVHVIEKMTEIAVLRCIDITLVNMTILTTYIDMRVTQRKIGFIMIEM